MTSPGTTYLSAIGGGLGDFIVALPVFRGLIEKEKARGNMVVAVMRTPRQAGFENLIPGLAGTVKEVDLVARPLLPSETYINLRGHRLQTDYFWGGPDFERDYPGFQINDILAEMCNDFGIDADFKKLIPFPFTNRPELSNTIICVPGTTVDTKTWSATNWLKLKQRLESTGMAVAMLGQPEHSAIVRELSEKGFTALATPSVADAVDIVSNVRAVVSVDTGLMHLAVQQGTATVCLFQDPIFYRPYAHAYKLLSKHCATICVENRMSFKPEKITEYPEWNWKTCEFNACLVPEEDRCINSISVEEVLHCLTEAAGYHFTTGRAIDANN